MGKEGGRNMVADWRYEGKGSLGVKSGSKYDNNSVPRPDEPIALKKRENPWEEILTWAFFLLPYFSDKGGFFPPSLKSSIKICE